MNNILILAADIVNGSNYCKQLIPIHGKPVISLVLDSFKSDYIYIVCNSKNLLLLNYLSNVYKNVNIIIIDEKLEIDKYNSFTILNSFYKGLSYIKQNDRFWSRKKLILNFGDTLVTDIPDITGDLLISSKNVLSPGRWTIGNIIDNKLKSIFDKRKDIEIKDNEAFVGYFQFVSVNFLYDIVDFSIKNKQTFYNVIEKYNKFSPFFCYCCQNWFDFGHKSGIVKANNYFYNSREFNSLNANSVLSIIEKKSTNKLKLNDEFDWYMHIPLELQTLIPRALSFTSNENYASLKMEMYGYPPLSELFIYGNHELEEWELILKRLFEVHKLLEDYKSELPIDNFNELYINKTWGRVNELSLQSKEWSEILEYSQIIVNGKSYLNIKYLKANIDKTLINIVNSVNVTIVHGDYCLSNILFDVKSLLCKLIDPRGRLKDKTIYGDPRYDIAKLRHSVVGGYDFIVHGIFKLERSNNIFYVEKSHIDFQRELEEIFDKLTIDFGYKVDEIKFIEALLFLSMIPLHKDSFNRQLMFFVLSVEKFNNYFKTV